MQSEREREREKGKEVESDLKALLDKVSRTKGISLTESCVFLTHKLTSMIPIMTRLEHNANLEAERQASNIRPANLQNEEPHMRREIYLRGNDDVEMESDPIRYTKENFAQRFAGKRSIPSKEGYPLEWKKDDLSDFIDREEVRSPDLRVKENFAAQMKRPLTISDFHCIYAGLLKKTETRSVVLSGANERVAAQLFSLISDVVELYRPINDESDVETVAGWLFEDSRYVSFDSEVPESYYTYLDDLEGNTATSASKHLAFNLNLDRFCYDGVTGRPSAIKKDNAGIIVSVAVFMLSPTNNETHVENYLQRLYCCAWACRSPTGYLIIPTNTNQDAMRFRSKKLIAFAKNTMYKHLSAKFDIQRENQQAFVSWILQKKESIQCPSLIRLLICIPHN